MKPSVISSVGHVALQVPDLDRAVEMSTTIMGLRVSRRDERSADLTHGAPHHSLQYLQSSVSAFDHVGFEAADDAALAEARSRLRRAGVRFISETPLDPELRDGFVFELPGGIPVEVYVGMPCEEPRYVPTGVRPTRFGHVNCYVTDPGPALDVLTEALDFRISDRVRGGAFVRCNADHHAFAVLPGDHKMHHHAWEVQDVSDLSRLGDVLFSSGSALLEGPVRHGIGANIAAYFRGVGGEGVEYYTDMERIDDEDGFVPGDWEVQGTAWYSRWTQRLPVDEFRELGAPSILQLGGAPGGVEPVNGPQDGVNAGSVA
jgi:catechol-2,3-dioxygenase